MTIFAKYEINAHKIAKDILVFAKVTKFRQIWSHCSQSTKGPRDNTLPNKSIQGQYCESSKSSVTRLGYLR